MSELIISIGTFLSGVFLPFIGEFFTSTIGFFIVGVSCFVVTARILVRLFHINF